MSRRVCVTGANGFVASHLIPKLLARGDEVVAVDKDIENIPTVQGVKKAWADISIPTLDELPIMRGYWEGCDSMIHLAAMAAPGIAEKNAPITVLANVLGTLNVLKLARDAGLRKVVFSSTAHVYGISPRYLPTDEEHPLYLQDVYTVTKIVGEDLCQRFFQNHHLPYTTLRMFNGYGPRQSPDYFIPATIAQAKKGAILLRGREVRKDFIFVEDMADAMIAALDSGYVGELNIGTGVQTTLERVGKIIAERYRVPLTFGEDVPGPTQMQCDLTRTKTILGWTPKIGIEEGLVKTMDWFDSH